MIDRGRRGADGDADRPTSSTAAKAREPLQMPAPPPLAVAEAIHAEKTALRLQVELERRVFERMAQFEAANHDVDALSYSVSHDVREPLRRIDCISLALLEDHAEALGLDGRDRLRRVRAGARRMGRSIDGLLEIAQFGHRELRRQIVDLSVIARAIAADLRDGDPARSVEFSIDHDLRAECDPGLARIVLENLLQNAWKFGPQEGLARIEVRWSADREAFLVRDNGAGFDMRGAAKLFVPFGRLHEPSECDGIGMGLAIVKRILLRHGGRVWAEGVPGQGARFWFTWS